MSRINLNNLNISLTQFNKLASGTYNAGEVKLASETSLKKVNNFVTSLGKNTTEISQDEVLAIKNAFVNALSQNGVNNEEINKVRKELGLAPDETAPQSLAERSLKPLSRQQIREIIDRNITDINASRSAQHKKGYKTSEQLYGTNQVKLQSLSVARQAAATATQVNRTQTETEDIADFQKLIEGDLGTVGLGKRRELGALALAQRDAILQRSGGNPKTTGTCTLEYETEGGQKIVFDSGKSEAETVKMLDEAFLRLEYKAGTKNRNDGIVDCLTLNRLNSKCPIEFQRMANEIRAEATAIFGANAVKQDPANFSSLVKSNDIILAVRQLTQNGTDLTPQNMRDIFRTVCMQESARNLIARTVEALMRETGNANVNPLTVQSAIKNSRPDIFNALSAAKTSEEAQAIIDAVKNDLRDLTIKAGAAETLKGKLCDCMNAAFAKEIGVAWKPGDAQLATFGFLANETGNKLTDKILQGKIEAKTPEDIEALFMNAARETAHERTEILRKTDTLDISPDAKDRMKSHLLKVNKLKHFDPVQAAAFAKQIDVKGLANILSSPNATREQIYAEMEKVSNAAAKFLPTIFAKAAELGPDEITLALPPMVFMAVDKEPGLAQRLESFLCGDGVSEEIKEGGQAETVPEAAGTFLMLYGNEEREDMKGPALATLGMPDMKPLLAQALFKAVDAAGFANLAPDEKLALFAGGSKAGKVVREAISSLPNGTPLTPSMLGSIATGALRGVGENDVAAARDAAPMQNIVAGSSPAAAKIRDFVLGSNGLDPNASVKDKAEAFKNQVNAFATKDTANAFAQNICKYSVKTNEDGTRTEDFNSVQANFDRDLRGKMVVTLPGVNNISRNYEEARDQLLRFIADDKNATFATASESLKRQTVMLMALIGQGTAAVALNSFNEPFKSPEKTFATVGSESEPGSRSTPLTFKLSKTDDGGIAISMVHSKSAKVASFTDGTGVVQTDPVASYTETKIDIAIPRGEMERMAGKDWSQIDADNIRAQASNGIDAQNNAIPQDYRLNATVTASVTYHLEAPQA